MRHQNEASCERCEEFLKKVHTSLLDWFVSLRMKYPEAHVSCGVRSELEQEASFKGGFSRAHFGKSPHNYYPALAIDIFRIAPDGKPQWSLPWYKKVIKENLWDGISWGGDFKSFPDSPHVELTNWKELAEDGEARLYLEGH